jgi:hypothetical protein
MFTTYFEKFDSTCQELKVELPYDKDYFVNECLSKGFLGCISLFLFTYEFTTQKPHFIDRFHWIVEMAVKHSPSHFE